jgi:hypothetical protein
VHEESAIAHRNRVFVASLTRSPPELVAVEDLARREHALEECRRGLLERTRLERNDHPLGRKEIS